MVDDDRDPNETDAGGDAAGADEADDAAETSAGAGGTPSDSGETAGDSGRTAGGERVGEETDALLDEPADPDERAAELAPPDLSDREVLAAFANADDSALQARDVAETLPIDVEDAEDRLADLRERDLLVVDEDAPGEALRLAPGAGAEALSDERVETDVEAQASKTAGVESPPHETETTTTPASDPQAEPAGSIYEPPADAIEAFDPPGTPEQAEQRREALGRAYAYLRERGRADRGDFVSAVFPEAPGAYENPDDGWWERVVRPGLRTLPGVETVDGGGSESDGEEFRFAAGNVDGGDGGRGGDDRGTD